MSLFGSIQLAANTLRANEIGIQVVGQNIANANTPGYIREEVNYVPATVQRQGGLLLGLGVRTDSIVQKVDKFVETRLRTAGSDRANSEVQQETYAQLEGLIGELSDTDLSTSLNNFFGAINEVLNQPDDLSIRNLAILQGKTLASDLQRLSQRVSTVRKDLNTRVGTITEDANRLIEEIRKLNIQIAETEGGDTSRSDAVGLRDQRGLALSKLSELINVRIDEQDNGTVNVFIEGEYVVYGGLSRKLKTAQVPNDGLSANEIRFADTDAPIQVSSGELAGLIAGRDNILGGFLEQLDDFAGTFISEFNQVFSSGQGLTGYQDITSFNAVDDASVALDEAGLPFTPVNGTFEVLVRNKQTGLTETTRIDIDLDGLDDDDTTLEDLQAQLNAVDGITATINSRRELRIVSDSSQQDIAFANDTSGVLASLGINTFFDGSKASDISVNTKISSDPSKFAVSAGGIGHDTENGVLMAQFLDRPLNSKQGSTLSVEYDRLVGSVTQGATVANSVAEGFRVFEESLNGQHLAVSGVSLDEEAIRLLQFQQSYQASAKYISTLAELLDLVVSL